MNIQDRNELVEANLPLVGYHVSETLARVPAHVERDDLASAGALALIKAADSYDPSTGVPFNRYAAIRIRGALVDELRSMDWASRGTRSKVRQLTATSDELTARLGKAPSREQLAEALGVPITEVDEVRADASRRVLSFEGYDGVLADVLPARTPGPEETVLVDERLQYLRAAVAALPERLRTIVEQVFFADRSVTDIAQDMGVTQSRVSQLRAEAMVLLRDGMNTHLTPELVAKPAVPTGIVNRRREAYFDAIGDHARRPHTIASQAAVAAQAATVTAATVAAHPDHLKRKTATPA